MKLEELVPPPELCKHIPAGEFGDSALVWMYRTALRGLGPIEENFCVTNRMRAEYYNREMYPAPTLEEIMAKLPFGTILQQDMPDVWVCIIHSGEPGIKIEKEQNPASCALRLWLKMKGVEE